MILTPSYFNSEAIERAKAREEAAKKAEEKEKKKGSSTSRASATERPAAQNTPAPSVIAPQVQIVNGRIVINQQSLVVAAQASTREDTDTYRRVEEDRPKLNYNPYSNRTPVERWKAEDTNLFYKVQIWVQLPSEDSSRAEKLKWIRSAMALIVVVRGLVLGQYLSGICRVVMTPWVLSWAKCKFVLLCNSGLPVSCVTTVVFFFSL